MVRKAKKRVPQFITKTISYTVRPPYHRLVITKWVGMVILGALWLVLIAFLSTVVAKKSVAYIALVDV